MKDLISIIVPIYKVEKYLKKCIDSIINQTYENIEIILVDDGSPDKCPNICDDYLKKDSRIRVIHKKNGGLSDSRNVGIKVAKGHYIGFVDSDDYIDRKMYQKLYEKIICYNADISICNYINIDENGEKIFPNRKNQSNIEKILNREDAIYELLRDIDITNHAWNKLYKKDLFNDVMYPIGKKFEDIGTTYKIFDKSKIIVYNPEKLYYYVKREGSILSKYTPQLLNDFIEITHNRIKFLEEKNYDKDNIIRARINDDLYYYINCAKNNFDIINDNDIVKEEYNFIKKIKLRRGIKFIKYKKWVLFFILLKISKKLCFYIIGNLNARRKKNEKISN